MRGYGGIGRHARFRFWWATVQVQVLLPAPEGLGNRALSFASVAQLVEQGTENPRVAGSIPAGGTNPPQAFSLAADFLCVYGCAPTGESPAGWTARFTRVWTGAGEKTRCLCLLRMIFVIKLQINRQYNGVSLR